MNADNPFWPKICYANASFLALTGYDPTIVTGESYPVILGLQSDHKLIADCAKRVLAGENVACEVQLYRKDGSDF
jgi:PAS domain-containing protein